MNKWGEPVLEPVVDGRCDKPGLTYIFHYLYYGGTIDDKLCQEITRCPWYRWNRINRFTIHRNL